MRPTSSDRCSASGKYPDKHTGLHFVLMLLVLAALGWIATAVLDRTTDQPTTPLRSTVYIQPITPEEPR